MELMFFKPDFRMYKVNITTGANSDSWLRQTMGGKGISHCGKYQFFIDSPTPDPDFWVVRNKYIKEATSFVVSPENTVLMVSEPLSVVNFPQRYCNQFALYYTCQEQARHINKVEGGAALPWFIGGVKADGHHTITYDKLKNSAIPAKTKLLSVITSNKAFTQGHQDRIDFVTRLKAYYGDRLDVFGRGFNEFEDKWDVLAPYKYHISLENSSSRLYWTEKISDCYLAGTFPIYYGCSNIGDYFPSTGFQTIDIADFDGAVAIIDQIIASNHYEQSLAALETCKNLVLDDYNIFTLISKCCDRLNPTALKTKCVLQPAKTLFDWHNFKLYFFKRNFFVVKGKLKAIFGKHSSLKS